jgi:hypothetical protein
VIEKKVKLDLKRWIGKAANDGLTTSAVLTELRGRKVALPSIKKSAK